MTQHSENLTAREFDSQQCGTKQHLKTDVFTMAGKCEKSGTLGFAVNLLRE